jgi:hypothetical protein
VKNTRKIIKERKARLQGQNPAKLGKYRQKRYKKGENRQLWQYFSCEKREKVV